MATKQELAHTLKRTETLARNTGRLQDSESLVLFEADRSAGFPWAVRLEQASHTGLKRRHSEALSWLPDSGRAIGWTKREAQETLRIVNGVLVDEMARKTRDNLGYEEN